MTATTLRDEDTRSRIVASAAATFARHGIDRVSLDEIASGAGVHRSTLHRSFAGGRDELVLAVLDMELELLTEHMGRLISEAPTAVDALVDSATFAVVEGRRSRLTAALLAEPDTRQALLSKAAGEFRSSSAALWKLVRDRPDANPANGQRWPGTDRVVDHLLRVLLSLVEDPGPIRTETQVRNYLVEFVAPGLLG